MTDKPRIVAATARIEKPRKPTRRQRITQQRQAQAWQRKANESEQLTLPLDAERREIIAARLAAMELDRMYPTDTDNEDHRD